MAHWLKNVNQFLEKLDDRAAEAIPDNDINQDEDEDDSQFVLQHQSILAARGLPISNDNNNDEQGNIQQEEMAENDLRDDLLMMNEYERTPNTPDIISTDPASLTTTTPLEKDLIVSLSQADEEPLSSSHKEKEAERLTLPVEDATTMNENIILQQVESVPAPEGLLTTSSSSVSPSEQKQQQQELLLHDQIQQYQERLDDLRDKLHDQQRITGEANREARTLRRSVVALNQQLEAADREIEAQRNELEEAGRRIEHERKATKDAIESLRNEHSQQIEYIQEQHQQQIQELKTALRLAERQHDQIGGDWNKEKSEYERTCHQLEQTIESLQQEKDALTSRIQTLVDQQESLGWRLESLTRANEAAELARDRAEQKVDETLEMHGQQIRARQAREAELEQTVAQLSAALAATEKTTVTTNAVGSGSNNNAAIDGKNEEIESLRQNLEHERSKIELLRNELAEVSKERDSESAALRQLQIIHDRQIAELNQQVQSLQKRQQELEGGSSEISKNSKHSSKLDDDYQEERTRLLAMQRTMSEELSKLRQQLSDSHAEVSALRSRLNVALHRATVAEAEAAESYDTVTPSTRRRRHHLQSRSSTGAMPSMKAAFFLTNASANTRQSSSNAFANLLDGIDELAAKMGVLLRNNAVARLLFVVYLVILHLWTFALLAFHAHSLDVSSSTFSAESANDWGRGPAALVRQRGDIPP